MGERVMETKVFACVINCMDGRTQEPVIAYLKERLSVDYVDTVTEPGPIGLLTKRAEPHLTTIKTRCDISVQKHGAVAMAVVGHHDCAGNPVPEATQREQIGACLGLLREWYPNMPLFGLWVDANRKVVETIADVPK